MRLPCSFCKGRFCKIYYGKNICPLRELAYNLKNRKNDLEKFLKEQGQGTAPNLLIGHNNWPRVSASIISTPHIDERAYKYDFPLDWVKHNLGIAEIVDRRLNLFSNYGKIYVKSQKTNRLLEALQEIALAKKQVDVEFKLYKKPKLQISLPQGFAPIGGKSYLENVRVIGNAPTFRVVEKIVYDTDLKAVEAIKILHERNIDNYHIIKLFSSSLLGKKSQRRFVPTRWAITAVDDIISKNIFKEVRNFKILENFEVYFSGYLGNYFLILFMPWPYSYELFEILVPSIRREGDKLLYTHDYELFRLRKNYAEETAGGYYATRMNLLQKMKDLRRQSSVLVLRFITKEYYLPLGVFVVREAVKKSLEQKVYRTNNLKDALEFVKNFVKEKFGIDVKEVVEKSKIIDQLSKQRTLKEFLLE